MTIRTLNQHDPTQRRRRADGERTRSAILRGAASLATVDGLDGLSIGNLATAIGISKSGLYAHFGSKEELQLATVAEAERILTEEVIQPALAARPGLAQLAAICEAYFSYLQRRVFPGGCFFAAASFEFDGRPGAVRDAIANMMDSWIESIEKSVRMAQEEGHIDPEVEPEQLAFEINAIFFGANFSYQLRGDKKSIDRAMTAIEARLESVRLVTPTRRLRRVHR